MSTKTKKTIVAIPKLQKTVYTVGAHDSVQTKMQQMRKIPINNIIKLNLTTLDIQKLELRLKRERMGLLNDIDKKISEPMAFNTHETTTLDQPKEQNSTNPFKSLIKRTQMEIKDTKPTITVAEKRDLIINSGIKRKCHKIMDVYNGQTWPSSSPYACWYDCHTFDTTPVGIPQLLIGDTFHCHGNFCSYNCALRYLCPDDEDDISQRNTNTDYFSGDDHSDKLQLLELLCRMETPLGFDETLKKSQKRLCLKFFGGNTTIDEYRSMLSSHTTYHIFRAPMVPISYQMEESSDRIDTKKKQKGVSLNMNKLEKAYNEFLDKHCNDETLLQKLYRNKRDQED
jgi:hypothetical protein